MWNDDDDKGLGLNIHDEEDQIGEEDLLGAFDEAGGFDSVDPDEISDEDLLHADGAKDPFEMAEEM